MEIPTAKLTLDEYVHAQIQRARLHTRVHIALLARCSLNELKDIVRVKPGQQITTRPHPLPHPPPNFTLSCIIHGITNIYVCLMLILTVVVVAQHLVPTPRGLSPTFSLSSSQLSTPPLQNLFINCNLFQQTFFKGERHCD